MSWRPRRWRHWTLRSRLVLVTASLTAVALLLANLAGVWLLRSYLTDQLDDRLAREDPLAVERACNTGPDGQPWSGPPPAQPRQGKGWPGLAGPEQILNVHLPDGTLLCTDREAGAAQFPGADVIALVGEPDPVTMRLADGTSWRATVQESTVHRTADGARPLVLKAVSLEDIDRTADGLLLINLAVELVVLLLLSLVAAVVVRLGLHPLTRMEAMATRISTGDLSHRADDADPHTESGRLGIALNSMLARIEAEVRARTGSEARLRRFVADAGHELRTPLTSIRGFAELYRRGGSPPGPALDENMSRIEAESARMGLLVEDLLLLATLDEQRPLQRTPVDLLQIAADTVRDAHARVPGRPVRLAAFGPDDGALEPVTVPGDESRLRQVATNLVNNALVHTPPEARITIRVGRWTDAGAPPAGDGGQRPAVPYAVLEVSDTGPGIAPDHAERVFERLYRVESSRARGRAGAGGSGLGLSIVAAIVRSHGGQVELITAPGRGATFRVLLPAD